MNIPAYITRARLAAELDIAESTVDDFVRRGVLPPPVKLTSGCVRWRWESVDKTLASMGKQENDSTPSEDEAGVQRAIQEAKDRGRDRAA